MATSPVTLGGGAAAALAASNRPPVPPPASDPTQALANHTVFLQLLVAQLKNQSPDNPADGTQFVTQLAQFVTLEQQTRATADLEAIRKLLEEAPPMARQDSSAAPAGGAESLDFAK